jgi:predicted transcriptional regulator
MTDSAIPDPTSAELAILKVLWRKGPATVRQVWEELGSRGSYTTTLKMLQVMLEKGLVRRDDSALSHVYEAVLSEEDTQRRLVNGLIDTAFSGSASQLVMRALSAKRVSPDELKQIQSLLAAAKKKSS